MTCFYYLGLGVLMVFSAWIQHYTDKKENKIFLIYKQIQTESGAKSYTYEEVLPNIWGNAQIFTIYEEALII
jgi:hypothetical protein